MTGPGHAAARLGRASIEEALFALPRIPVALPREDLRDRLLRAIHCLYGALDADVIALAHLDGLTEAGAMARESRAILERAGDPAALEALRLTIAHLSEAEAALLRGADAVREIQLERRTEIVSGAAQGPLPARPLRASVGLPQLHAPARLRILPHVSVDPDPPLPEPAAAPPPPPAPAPRTFAELEAFAADAASGTLARRLMGGDAPAPPAPVEEAPYAPFEPAVEEVQVLRDLARDCLEDIAAGRSLRKRNALESWLDQGPFEQRLLENIDAFAALGGGVLPQVSLFHTEARAPDPERAFAVALTLGCIEGSDTVGAAVMTLKQSPPEEHPGWIEGLSLAPSPAIDAAMADLCAAKRPELVALALDVLHARGAISAEALAPALSRPEPAIRVRAARALARALPSREAIPLLEEMLAEPADDQLFLAAAEALLCRGHARALSALRALVTEGAGPRSPRQEGALGLLCMAGRATDVDLLIAAVSAQPTARLLRGLGRFGHVESLPALLAHLHHLDAELVAAAAEALERITGAGLREIIEEPWEVELPPEAADAVGALPIPMRKVERVITDPERWSAWLTGNARRFDGRLKYRAGVPFTPLQIVAELEAPATPLEAREEATLELALVTGLRFGFSPSDWVAQQQRALTELRVRVGSLSVAAGAWSLGLTRESEPPAARGSSRPPGAVPPPLNAARVEVDVLGFEEQAEQAAPQTLPPVSRVPDSLPFRRNRSATTPGLSAPSPPGVIQGEAEPGGEHRDVVETAVGPLVPGKAALPFHRAESPAAEQAHDVEPPEVTTAPVPLVRRGPVLPFGVPVPPPELGPGAGRAVADEDEEAEVRTAPARLVSGQPALPFQPPAPEHEPRFGPAPEPGSLDGGLTSKQPPPGALIMPGSSSVPAMDRPDAMLSLVQYASLCAELAVFPDEGEATFRKYGLESQEKRSAVDAWWKRQLRENQLQHAAWQEAYRHYHSYWLKRAAARR